MNGCYLAPVPRGLWEGEFHALVGTPGGALLSVSLSCLSSCPQRSAGWGPLNQP